LQPSSLTLPSRQPHSRITRGLPRHGMPPGAILQCDRNHMIWGRSRGLLGAPSRCERCRCPILYNFGQFPSCPAPSRPLPPCSSPSISTGRKSRDLERARLVEEPYVNRSVLCPQGGVKPRNHCGLYKSACHGRGGLAGMGVGGAEPRYRSGRGSPPGGGGPGRRHAPGNGL